MASRYVYDFCSSRASVLTCHELRLNEGERGLEAGVILDVNADYSKAEVRDEEMMLKRYRAGSVKSECLLKIGGLEGSDYGPMRTAHFVSSEIPESFAPLRHDEYILYSLWGSRMEKAEKIPNFNEIRGYFDIGEAENVIYIDECSSRKDSKAIVNSFGSTISFSGRKFLIKSNRSCLFILKKQELLEEFLAHCKEERVAAFKMQSLPI